MTIASALHNLSRSIGYALLASGGVTVALSFVSCEMMLYLVWKILRKDYMYWFRVDGFLGVVGSFINRVIAKVIADFSGCLHLR